MAGRWGGERDLKRKSWQARRPERRTDDQSALKPSQAERPGTLNPWPSAQPASTSAHSMPTARTFPKFNNRLQVPRICRERVGQGAVFSSGVPGLIIIYSWLSSLVPGGTLPRFSLRRFESRRRAMQSASQSARLFKEQSPRFPKQGGARSPQPNSIITLEAPSCPCRLPTTQSAPRNADNNIRLPCFE